LGAAKARVDLLVELVDDLGRRLQHHGSKVDTQ
jgi:hypothetical protein